MSLTDAAIRNAKPSDKPYKLADEKGLYLLVNPNGSRYWRLKYRFYGKEKVFALGVYPEVSLAEARGKRDGARRHLRDGIDPSAERRDRKHASREAAANSFDKVAEEWVDRQRTRWTPGHADRVLHSLRRDIFSDLGTRAVNSITAPELLRTVRKIEARGTHETAAKVLQRCGAVFRYAIATGRCDRNPAADLQGALTPPKRSNNPALNAADLPEFLRKLDHYDGHVQTKLALKLLVHTFVRTGELRGAEWPEFDYEARLWRIPAARTKMKDAHLVPLSDQVIELLRELQALTGQGRLLFPHQSKPDKPMSENTMLYALYRMGYHSRATGHGFRATASTLLNEMGFSPDAIERQLAHVPRNKVRAAYNKAEYLPERIKMMQTWSDYLRSLGDGAQVVPLRQAK